MLNNLKDFSLDEQTDWAGVRRAYMDQLKVWHPDRFGNDENLRRKGEEKTKELTQAYNQLKKELSDLESNGVNIEWNQPILPQLIQCGVLRVENSKQNRNFDQQEYQQKSFNQEPLVGQSGDRVKAKEEFEQYHEESIWNPQLIAAAMISCFAFLFACYFAYKNFLAPRPARIVYGPPADLSKYAKKPAPVDTFAKDLKESEGVEQMKPGEGVVEGQLGSERIISGVTKSETEQAPEIIKYASRCDVDGVKRLIERGSPIDKEDSDGLSSLSWAAKKNCEGLARFLVSKGANTNHISSNGFTPLAWAKWFKNIEVIRVLELDKRHLIKR